MDGVDGSDHYAREEREAPPSLLNIVIDTNPRAWSLLKDVLPLSKLTASLEVFVNAHLALNHSNQVTVIASHLHKAEFLYPPRTLGNEASSQDVEMSGGEQANGTAVKEQSQDDANFYRPFAMVKAALDSSLTSLIESTEPSTIRDTYSTSLAGALTLALTYTNKISVGLSEQNPSLAHSSIPNETSSSSNPTSLSARILVISVSSANASQYIPLMNTVFAAQRLRIPIDVLSIPLGPAGKTGSVDGSASFLQQAADATSGVFLPLTHPHGILQTLFLAYLPSGASREMLLMPTMQGVDFRAACFCHQKTVDIGYVCSICLSIFCEPPADKECLTCGAPLRLGGEGWARPPAVLPKKKKAKKRRRDDSGTATPVPG